MAIFWQQHNEGVCAGGCSGGLPGDRRVEELVRAYPDREERRRCSRSASTVLSSHARAAPAMHEVLHEHKVEAPAQGVCGDGASGEERRRMC